MCAAKNAKLSASLEDYLEAIFNLAGQADVVRSKDITELLSVSKSSVTGALRALNEKGLVNYKPYDYVTLTESGQAQAAEIVRKHSILKSFFVNVLGVEADVAQQAACKAEHTLGREVIGRLLLFSEFITRNGTAGGDIVSEVERFYKSESSGQRKTKKQPSRKKRKCSKRK